MNPIPKLSLKGVIPVADMATFKEAAVEEFGVSRRSIERWIENGVDPFQADRIAIKLFGVDAITLFGPEWEEAVDAAVEEAERPRKRRSRAKAKVSA